MGICCSASTNIQQNNGDHKPVGVERTETMVVGCHRFKHHHKSTTGMASSDEGMLHPPQNGAVCPNRSSTTTNTSSAAANGGADMNQQELLPSSQRVVHQQHPRTVKDAPNVCGRSSSSSSDEDDNDRGDPLQLRFGSNPLDCLGRRETPPLAVAESSAAVVHRVTSRSPPRMFMPPPQLFALHCRAQGAWSSLDTDRFGCTATRSFSHVGNHSPSHGASVSISVPSPTTEHCGGHVVVHTDGQAISHGYDSPGASNGQDCSILPAHVSGLLLCKHLHESPVVVTTTSEEPSSEHRAEVVKGEDDEEAFRLLAASTEIDGDVLLGSPTSNAELVARAQLAVRNINPSKLPQNHSPAASTTAAPTDPCTIYEASITTTTEDERRNDGAANGNTDAIPDALLVDYETLVEWSYDLCDEGAASHRRRYPRRPDGTLVMSEIPHAASVQDVSPLQIKAAAERRWSSRKRRLPSVVIVTPDPRPKVSHGAQRARRYSTNSVF